MKKIALLVFVGLLYSCSATKQTPSTKNETKKAAYSYLALGDSYTIGESVCETCTYSHQLVDTLQLTNNTNIDLKIIAKTGWTTSDLLSALATKKLAPTYDFVTLLIGVNNQYQQKDFTLYEKEFPMLLNKAIQYAGGTKEDVVVLSIPDYAYTPFGKEPTPEAISMELREYNAFAKDYSEKVGVRFLNITDITQQGLERPELVASDGLHPSEVAFHLFMKRLYEMALPSFD